MLKSHLKPDIIKRLRELNQSDKGKLSDDLGIRTNSLETYLIQERRALLKTEGLEAIKSILGLETLEEIYFMEEITKSYERD